VGSQHHQQPHDDGDAEAERADGAQLALLLGCWREEMKASVPAPMPAIIETIGRKLPMADSFMEEVDEKVRARRPCLNERVARRDPDIAVG